MLIIDKYSYINELRKYSPIVKFYFAIGLMSFGMIMNHYILYGIIFLVNFILITKGAKIPVNKYIKFLCIPFSFLFLGMIPLLLSFGKETTQFIFSINIKRMYFGITKQGIQEAILLLFRSLSCISCTFFLILTTPMNDLVRIFQKHRIPFLVIELMVLMYRFIFILLEEFHNLIIAQDLKLGYINIKSSYRSVSILVVCLFHRVMDRYQCLQYSLEARGFNGKFYM
ncbi:cobalt ECF transporter T component CbiQ [Garciella nitratireducens]|uniref:cobalt ECF transporter T component CbiQ n=1 Tax=Garciella nitratireducens TaxID=218205 RepID=UPI000DEBB9F7|nr:cobalt ECF transporter T component CbiQ [Garciella nitratireducens]RBP41568.1 cobalt/nickel transport system permease protein [Garciella nitratireducens]